MPKNLSALQSLHNICLPSEKNEREVRQQERSMKKAVRRSIVLSMVSAITFLLSLAIAIGIADIAGTFAVIGTATLMLASVATVFEARSLYAAVREENRVDHLKTEFIALASHQMRTPLSSMQWYAELLNEEKHLTKQQKEYAKELISSVRRMNSLIESLLNAAQLECEEIDPNIHRVQLKTLLTDAVKTLNASAKEKGIRVAVHMPEKTVTLFTDKALLGVVVQNMFNNAVKYTKTGGTIAVRIKPGRNAVTIAVEDTGIGIPKKDQARIFQRLFRASNVLKTDTDGNGLGLYISQMIVQSLGGSITMKSTEGKGSTFTVKLPLTKRNEEKAVKKQDAAFPL